MVNLNDFIAFDGNLSAVDRQWPLLFKARIVDSGEVEFEITPLSLDADTVEISRLCHSEKSMVQYFSLSGIAEDGTRFESATLHFNRVGTESSRAGATLKLNARCSAGVFTRTIEPVATPTVRQGLRGFECFGGVRASCPLGSVTMVGMSPLPDGDKLCGYLQIVTTSPPNNLLTWRAEVDKLFNHVRRVMSFAASRDLKAPITQVWSGNQWMTEAYSQTTSLANGLQTFHHLDLQSIFAVAVSSYFVAPIAAKNLFFAIEWFTMAAGYTEMRLVNAMTALENLTNSNLEEGDKLLLPPGRFRKIAKIMRGALDTIRLSEVERPFRADLPAKMQDLNRRPFRDKVTLLAERWGVPLRDLPSDGLENAINARNRIIHRGHYYDDPAMSGKDQDLWEHVLLAREIIVRMVLAVLGFKGRYISFRGGYHLALFPPQDSGPAKN